MRDYITAAEVFEKIAAKARGDTPRKARILAMAAQYRLQAAGSTNEVEHKYETHEQPKGVR